MALNALLGAIVKKLLATPQFLMELNEERVLIGLCGHSKTFAVKTERVMEPYDNDGPARNEVAA